MVLCHRSHQSKLSWDQELFSRGLCYDVVKRCWFWADATILQEQRAHIPCTKACSYRAARLLAQELQAYMHAQADAHGVFVQWQEWLSIHLGETETSVIDVAGIVAKLGLSQPDLPWIDEFRFWPSLGRNQMPSRWRWSAGKNQGAHWCRMLVHVLCRFTSFSYPAMNLSFCVVTAVSDMLWFLFTASWDRAHLEAATYSFADGRVALPVQHRHLWCEQSHIVLLQLWAVLHMTNQTVTKPTYENSHLHLLNIVCCECPKPRHGTSTQLQVFFCQRPCQRTSDKGSGMVFVIPFECFCRLRCMCSVVPCCAMLCHTCVSCFKVFCRWVTQVLFRDLTATLSTLAGGLSRSDSEDTLEEQAALLLQLPQELEDVCAQLCEKLQKVPLPTLGRVAAPLGSVHPLPSSKPGTNVADDHVRCTVMALAGSGRRGRAFCPQGSTMARCHAIWLLVSLLGCCHFSEEDIVVFPRLRLNQRFPVHGPEVVLKLITSNHPPPANIRVVIGKAAPQPGTSPLYEFCELQTLMLRDLDQVGLRDLDLRCPDSPLAKQLRQRFYEMLRCNVWQADVVRISCWSVYVNL